MIATDHWGLRAPDFATLSADADAFFFGDFRWTAVGLRHVTRYPFPRFAAVIMPPQIRVGSADAPLSLPPLPPPPARRPPNSPQDLAGNADLPLVINGPLFMGPNRGYECLISGYLGAWG